MISCLIIALMLQKLFKCKVGQLFKLKVTRVACHETRIPVILDFKVEYTII